MDGWVYEKISSIESMLQYLIQKLQEAEEKTKKEDLPKTVTPK